MPINAHWKASLACTLRFPALPSSPRCMRFFALLWTCVHTSGRPLPSCASGTGGLICGQRCRRGDGRWDKATADAHFTTSMPLCLLEGCSRAHTSTAQGGGMHGLRLVTRLTRCRHEALTALLIRKGPNQCPQHGTTTTPPLATVSNSPLAPSCSTEITPYQDYAHCVVQACATHPEHYYTEGGLWLPHPRATHRGLGVRRLHLCRVPSLRPRFARAFWMGCTASRRMGPLDLQGKSGAPLTKAPERSACAAHGTWRAALVVLPCLHACAQDWHISDLPNSRGSLPPVAKFSTKPIHF